MPIGVLIDSLAVLAGALTGSFLKGRIPAKISEEMPVLFGFCAMSIGIGSIVKVSALTASILAILVGYLIGCALKLEERCTRLLDGILCRMHLGLKGDSMTLYITVAALFCFSGFGWYGALSESIGGNHALLMSKAVLDFFTALLFGAVLGRAVAVIPCMQLVVLLLVFGAGRLAAPFVTDAMFAGLSAAGGIITLATGFRVAKVKSVQIINLMPALILIFPLTALLG